MEKFMSPQTEDARTEDTRQIGGQILPSNDGGGGKGSRKSWLFNRDCSDCGGRLVDVGHLVARQSPKHSKYGNGSSGCSRSLGGFTKTNCGHRRNHPARKRAAIHHFADLFEDEWLSQKVVFRYWGACQTGSTACSNRNARGRSATPASPQQPVNCAGESRTRFHHQDPVFRTLEKQCCFPTGRRQRGRHLQCE